MNTMIDSTQKKTLKCPHYDHINHFPRAINILFEKSSIDYFV